MVRLMRKSITLVFVAALLLALSARTPALAAGPISLVKDINTDLAPGARSANPTAITALGSKLFFAASDGSSGQELWSTIGQATLYLPGILR
jgi:hypothetical protein